jgi:hypothetical protein
MTDERITNYYLLCTVRNGYKRHIIDEFDERELKIVFTKEETMLYLRRHDGHYIAREIVVGGSQAADRQPILVI